MAFFQMIASWINAPSVANAIAGVGVNSADVHWIFDPYQIDASLVQMA